MDCSTPGFPVLHYLLELKLMSIESVMPSNHLILHPPLLRPSIFPSIRVFFSESALHIRRPKYWSFSFSVSPSNEYSGLISILDINYLTSSDSVPPIGTSATGTPPDVLLEICKAWDSTWRRGRAQEIFTES